MHDLVKFRFRPELYVPLTAGDARIGWLRPELAARLGAWPAVFSAGPDRVALLEPGGLAAVVEALAGEGFIRGWRNERTRVADLFEIERAAARPFGLTTQAVHVNGVVAGERMWLARRAASKAIDPGLLDNLVGGGIPAGLSPEDTLLKEAWEEAGIPAGLARSAVAGGTLHILREVAEGVQSELLRVYDLDLPADFAPRNHDGEVLEFRLCSFDEVRASAELTLEAELAAQDYFSRRSAPRDPASAGEGRAI